MNWTRDGHGFISVQKICKTRGRCPRVHVTDPWPSEVPALYWEVFPKKFMELLILLSKVKSFSQEHASCVHDVMLVVGELLRKVYPNCDREYTTPVSSVFISSFFERLWTELVRVTNLSQSEKLLKHVKVVSMMMDPWRPEFRFLGRKTEVLTKSLKPPLRSFQRCIIIRNDKKTTWMS